MSILETCVQPQKEIQGPLRATESLPKNVKKRRLSPKAVRNEDFVPQIRWPDTLVQLFLHIGCVYGLILCLVSAKFYTILLALPIGLFKPDGDSPNDVVMEIFPARHPRASASENREHNSPCSFLTIYVTGFGITAGAHRLWSHRAYKAKWPLRLLLVILFTITGQRHVYAWALDHRVHHKYSETDADPHNAKRGFSFHTLYPPLFAIFNVILPVAIPVYFWNETIWNSFWINFNTRFTITLNIAFFVNSVAHMWGQKPYDKDISPVENLAVSLAALGEGWHNYHHVFPWDYKTGWAYDLKSVSKGMIARRAKKKVERVVTPRYGGYGDTDIEKEDMEELETMAEENELLEH
ncbi:hypothetical protein NQ317_010171 [Molorchus minor]|uniref:Fatty acid desaturase domain-containing protein n=1 Tax=Molorchus minor TaxID=1323400 RepID=A0ABQ9IWA6_9CUCU|nr:hypothetical protein NQ317_010171 [Molorchus minor]